VSWGLGMRLFDRKPMAYLMVLLAETEVILSLDLGEYWTYKGQIIDLTIFLQYSEKNTILPCGAIGELRTSR